MDMTNTNTNVVTGKWAKHGDEFVAQIRCGGRGEQFIGRYARLIAKSGKSTLVTLTEVVKDYGANDVVLYRFREGVAD